VSRLALPLKYQTLWNTGDIILRGELDLLLKDSAGNWPQQTFRVDSASDMTTFPAFRAKQLGLPIPKNPAPLTHEQTGLEVRSGYLRCQVVGLGSTEYIFPCFFLGDPDTPPAPATPPARVPRNLLGLSGVIDKMRISFDGKAVPPHAPYGHVIVETITP
jgi:hypothetical protein